MTFYENISHAISLSQKEIMGTFVQNAPSARMMGLCSYG